MSKVISPGGATVFEGSTDECWQYMDDKSLPVSYKVLSEGYRKQADNIDGYDRDDIGESPDY